MAKRKKKMLIVGILLILGVMVVVGNKNNEEEKERRTAMYIPDTTTETGYRMIDFNKIPARYKLNTSKTSEMCEGATFTWDNETRTYGMTVTKAIKCNLYLEKEEPNEPNLVENMIPVVYDGSKWVKASSTGSNWYDYDNQEWANAVTVVSNKRTYYKDLAVGEEVEMEDILGMYVWIPRYEYKYSEMANYAGGDANTPGEIEINFVEGTRTEESDGYIIHPAFRDASSPYTNNAYTEAETVAYQFGGWDRELTGFWMAKFEVSNSTANPMVKPDVSSLRSQNVKTQFTGASNISSYQGISLDSHMSKNSEWGAVAYLSQSRYGKYGNSDYTGRNKEIYINNSSGYYTGRSMGMYSGATGNNYGTDGTYKYDDTKVEDGTYAAHMGTGASTTGNITGVYDMVGGAWEYQMGWLNTASSNWGWRDEQGTDTNSAGFTSAPSDHKYYEEYTSATTALGCGNKPCYGMGLSETAGWYGDYQNAVSNRYPWFLRGASYLKSTNVGSGVFALYYNDGDSGSGLGFRAVLT